MDAETIAAISGVAETITSIGILLVWVYAERRDNKSLWSIIEALVSLRLKQIQDEDEEGQKNLTA